MRLTVVGYGVPSLIDLGAIPDKRTLHHGREVEPYRVIFYDGGHRCCLMLVRTDWQWEDV